jgi:hypothetical protein
MLEWFSVKQPMYDVNRVYTCGHSSGAIFSYYLAFKRSEIFAAAVPVAGQMALTGQTIFPETVVPIRAFNGTTDATVNYATALTNITAWADRVARYFPDAAIDLDTLNIDGYRQVARRVWRGGSNDIEFFSVVGEGHNINWNRILPLMWEFMNSHVRNQSGATPLLLNTSEQKVIIAQGENATINLRFTEGATITLEGAPAIGWNFDLIGNTVRVTAPNEFFSDAIGHSGSFTIRATLGGQSVTRVISYEMRLRYFVLGDVFRNNAGEPVGVVVWVSPNLLNGIVISLEDPDPNPNFRDIQYGRLAPGFGCPDPNNGWANTAALVAMNPTIAIPNMVTQSAFMWAANYSYRGVSGWHLPAIEELELIYPNVAIANAKLAELGAELILTNVAYFSSTIESTGATTSLVRSFHFGTNTRGGLTSNNGASIGFQHVRAIKRF